MRSLITEKLHPTQKKFFHHKTNVYENDLLETSKRNSDHMASMTVKAGFTVKELIKNHLNIGKKKMMSSITTPALQNKTMTSQPSESWTLIKDRIFSKKGSDKVEKHHRYANKLFD